MKIWKSLAGAVVVATLVLAGGATANAAEVVGSASGISSAVSAPALASSSPTGQYEWVCVLTNGNSYSMADGTALTSCHGSWLQKYLNGVQLAVYNITGGGTVATASIACVLTITSNVVGVFTPGGILVWLVRTAKLAATAASNPCRA